MSVLGSANSPKNKTKKTSKYSHLRMLIDQRILNYLRKKKKKKRYKVVYSCHTIIKMGFSFDSLFDSQKRIISTSGSQLTRDIKRKWFDVKLSAIKKVGHDLDGRRPTIVVGQQGKHTVGDVTLSGVITWTARPSGSCPSETCIGRHPKVF